MSDHAAQKVTIKRKQSSEEWWLTFSDRFRSNRSTWKEAGSPREWKKKQRPALSGKTVGTFQDSSQDRTKEFQKPDPRGWGVEMKRAIFTPGHWSRSSLMLEHGFLITTCEDFHSQTPADITRHLFMEVMKGNLNQLHLSASNSSTVPL